MRSQLGILLLSACLQLWCPQFSAGFQQQQHASTPPRGWNSYDSYSWVISEEDFLRNAQLVAEKLLPYGYEYVVIDFLWYRRKEPGASVGAPGFDCIDEWGRPIPDPARWPSSTGGKGLKPIADQVHAMGLKLGIHVMRGMSTQAVNNNSPIFGTKNPTWRARDIALQGQPCSWMPLCFVSVNESSAGGKAFVQSLYDQYASWGVDYVKHDCVFGVDDLSLPEISAASQAIVATGRAMVYSISPGVHANTSMAKLINKHVNMYRVTSDDWDTWNDLRSHFDVARDFADAGLIGATGLLGSSWVDLDMLPIGYLTDPGANHGPYRSSRLTLGEQRTQVTLWAMAKSPIMFGGDMVNVDTTTLELLTNPTILEINANSSGNKEVSVSSLRPPQNVIAKLCDCEIAKESIWSLRDVASLKKHEELCQMVPPEEANVVHEGCMTWQSLKASPLFEWNNHHKKRIAKKDVTQAENGQGAGNIRIWIAHGQEGVYYVAIFNLGRMTAIVSLLLENLILQGRLKSHVSNPLDALQCIGKDVWNGYDVKISKGRLSAIVMSHGCRLYSLQCGVPWG